jgi:hypothetical protein
MRGVYRANLQVTGLTAGRTMIYLTAPAAKAVEILSATITPIGSNVTNQNLEACLQRISVLGTPTVGATLTPSPSETGDQAAATVAKGTVTASEPTYAANTQIGREGFASLAGYRFQPVPEERPVIAPGDSWGLRLLNSALTSADFDVEIVLREIG